MSPQILINNALSEAPTLSAAGNARDGQPTPLSASVPPSAAQNISTSTGIAKAVPPQMQATFPGSATVTPQRRLGCPLCTKTFASFRRAEACYNKHLEWKRYVCRGMCGDVTW
jgi:hypothetical protein